MEKTFQYFLELTKISKRFNISEFNKIIMLLKTKVSVERFEELSDFLREQRRELFPNSISQIEIRYLPSPLKALTPTKILGVSENADRYEIKEAFRREVKYYHPDLEPDPERKREKAEMFSKLKAAYDILMESA